MKTSLGNTKMLQANVEVWQQLAHTYNIDGEYDDFVGKGLLACFFGLLPSGIQLMKRNGRKCFINASPFERLLCIVVCPLCRRLGNT